MASIKKIDNYYLWGIKGILFLLPFIPLYVTPSIVFPYITGKNFAFRILVEFAAALWIGLISANKEYRLRNSAVTISILVFTFIVGLADLFGVNPYKSFWSNYERMEGYITILHLALYFMIVKSVFRAKSDWKIFFTLFVAASALVSLNALVAPKLTVETSRLAWEYGTRISGTIGNPPFLASYLLLSVFLGFVLIVNTQRMSLKCIYLALIIINSITIYFSASRGAILAAIIGAIIFGLFYLPGRYGISREKLIKKIVLPVIGILIISSVGFMTVRDADFIKHDKTLSRFAGIFSDASVQTRFTAWQLAWEGIKERPVLGWGQENFIGVYTVNRIPFVNEQIWVDRAHNIIIDWLVNAGSLGLIAYLAVFGAAFYLLQRAYNDNRVTKNEAVIIAISFIAYLIQNLFTFDTLNTYLLFFTLLAYVDGLAESKNSAGLNVTKTVPKQMKTISVSVALLVLLVFCGMSYFINYKPIKEANLFIRTSTNPSNAKSFTALLGDYNRALSLQTFGDSLVREAMNNMSFSIIKKNQYTEEGAAKFVEAAFRELEKEVAANPYDLEYLTNSISSYLSYLQIVGNNQVVLGRTEALIRKCIGLNPEYEWPYMALADVYFFRKDYELAFVNVKRIADADPQNDMKQLKLALAGILISRDDVVTGAFENIRKIRTAHNARASDGESYLSFFELYQIAQTYNEAKKYPKALQYYQETISRFPEAIKSGYLGYLAKNIMESEAKIRFETAIAYLAVGDKANALKEVRKAAELDPLNYAEGPSMINSLNK